MWGVHSCTHAEWNLDKMSERLASSTARYLLGFNEPNHKVQANLLPTEAAVSACHAP